MTKLEFDKLLKPLIELYDEIELDLINNILNRIDNYTSVQGSLEWYVDKLGELNVLDKDNLKVLKKDKKKLKQILTELVDKVGHNTDDFDILQESYDNGTLKINPTQIYNSKAIDTLISNALSDTTDIMDLINTKALEGAKEEYKKILNKAYIETSSGVYTYNESIRRALDEMAEKGIQIIHYESGRTLSIEPAVRRDVITRENKLVGDIELQHAKEAKTNLVYVSQHLGARVRTKYTKHDYEAHAEWQGKVYMIDGSSDKYDNFYEKTGYGEMLGLKGINCHHNFYPYFEGEKIPERISLEENAKRVELLETKRSFERSIRKLKRAREIYKHQDDKGNLKKVNDKLTKVNKNYNQFLNDNDLTRDYDREYVSTNKKEDSVSYKDITKEWSQKVGNEKGICENQYFFVDKNNVKYVVDNINVILDHTENEIIIASWFANSKKINIRMLPRVLNPKNIKTADFIEETSGITWEIKEPTGNTLGTTMINQFKGQKEKAHRFIIDIHKTKMSVETAESEIELVLSNKRYDWIEEVVLTNDNKVLKVFGK